MLYLLDTCTFSYLEDPESVYNESVLAALQSLGEEDEVCLSILSIYEIEYGLKRAEDSLASELENAKRHALSLYRTLPLSRQGATIFADLKCAYRARVEQQIEGKELTRHLSRHTVDLMIASLAIEHDGTVVSNDRIFRNLEEMIPGLAVTDWTVREGDEP